MKQKINHAEIEHTPIYKSKGIKVIERKIKPEEMKNFVGCFLTGTAAEVTPVSQISNYTFKVCDVITELNKAYQILVRKKNLGIKKHVGTVRKCVLYWYFMQAGNYVIRLDLELNYNLFLARCDLGLLELY